LVRVDGDTVRFNQPIVINEVCLNCHGPSVGLKPGLRPSAKSPCVKTGIVVSRGSAAAREG
jgi:hypothetical protein